MERGKAWQAAEADPLSANDEAADEALAEELRREYLAGGPEATVALCEVTADLGPDEE